MSTERTTTERSIPVVYCSSAKRHCYDIATAMPHADVEGENADFCGWLEPIRSITYEAADDERPFACGCVA